MTTLSSRRSKHRRAHARRPVRRNRRRGAPRSLVVRRLIALMLAAGALLMVLRPGNAAEPAPSTPAAVDEPRSGIPLVLPLADPAGASVLSPGQAVDLYVGLGDEPPTLLLSGVPLLDLHTSDASPPGITSHTSTGAYIVVEITDIHLGLVESLLAATTVVATVSAVDFD